MILNIRPPKLPKGSEREEGRGGIHERIVGALRFAGKIPAVSFWHTKNGGNCSPAEANRRWRAGVLSGVPDLLFTVDLPTALEVKTTRGELSQAQREWLEYHAAAGWRCAVGYGYDQCSRYLIDWGYL